MGLFDFVSNIGKKIFGDDEDPAAKIKEHIEQDNPGIANLAVSVDGETAQLAGQADSKSAFDKAVLMAGNALGITTVHADELTYPAETAPAAEAVEYYEIQKGDTLWAIATKFYGDGNKYQKIFEDNREVIKDPDLIFPGQKILINKA